MITSQTKTIRSTDKSNTIWVLLCFLQQLKIMEKLNFSATDVTPFTWNPTLNGGMGSEEPHGPQWILRVWRKEEYEQCKF
jgi:hypothetical protein